MHPHEQLLTKLFQSLNEHNHKGMAECYDEHAKFRDIAFDLSGRAEIHGMWEMICSDNDLGPADIVVTVQELVANDTGARAIIVDDYTFRKTGRKVHNMIESKFELRDGLILRQKDSCDAVDWAKQAFGPLKGLIPGYCERVRRKSAMKGLREFMKRKTQLQESKSHQRTVDGL